MTVGRTRTDDGRPRDSGLRTFLRAFRPRWRRMPRTFGVAFVLILVGQMIPWYVHMSRQGINWSQLLPAESSSQWLIDVLWKQMRDIGPLALQSLPVPWEAAPWLSAVLGTIGAGIALMRRQLRSPAGLLAMVAGAFSVALGTFLTGPFTPGVVSGLRVFPGAVVALFGAAAGTWLLVRTVAVRKVAFAGALPTLLLAAGAARNLSLVSDVPEMGLLFLLGGPDWYRFALPWSSEVRGLLSILSIPVLLLPALAAGEGLGLRESLRFLGRALRRRTTATLLAHLGLALLLVLLTFPAYCAFPLLISLVGLDSVLPLLLWLTSGLGLALVLALFFPLSLAAAHALRVTVDGPEKERG